MFGYVETNHVEINDKFKLISINRVLKGSQVDSSSVISLEIASSLFALTFLLRLGNSKVHLWASLVSSQVTPGIHLKCWITLLLRDQSDSVISQFKGPQC